MLVSKHHAVDLHSSYTATVVKTDAVHRETMKNDPLSQGTIVSPFG
jgi:hypothetical protein